MMLIVSGGSLWRNESLEETSRLRFGPAGYPAGAKGDLDKVFAILRETGLDALEYAAVYGLRLSKKRAKKIGSLAEANDIAMSVHAPYYISLLSKSQKTRARSKERLVKALKFAPSMRVRRIVFHAGGYCGMTSDDAFPVVKEALQEVWQRAGHFGDGALLAPEIAGKLNAFGSIDEIISLCAELEGTVPTIDWAHVYARSQGEVNDKDSYLKVLERFEGGLGDNFTKNMHFHISGITFTEAGERSHRPLGSRWGPDILPLMDIIREVGYTPTIISETPEPLKGALYAKFVLEELEKHER